MNTVTSNPQFTALSCPQSPPNLFCVNGT